jgi:DNA-binding transcriptional ArsR family regulator
LRAVTTDDILRAIAEPKRRAILQMVASDEMAAGDIAARFAVTRPAISQHLTILREAGLLSERRDGARRLYRARPQELAELRSFLDTMWPATLERFKAAAEAGQAEPDPAQAVRHRAAGGRKTGREG